MSERRREKRVYRGALVQVESQRCSQLLRVANFSSEGLFVETDTPEREQTVVKLRFGRGEGRDLELLATVMHCLLPEEAKGRALRPGMGLQLFELNPVSREFWHEWIEKISAMEQEPNPEQQASLTPKRLHPRVPIDCEVILEGDNLQCLGRAKDLSLGGLQLETAAASGLHQGQEIEVKLKHVSLPKLLRAYGRVQRVESEGRRVALAFGQLDAEQRAALEAIMEFGSEAFDDHLELVVS